MKRIGASRTFLWDPIKTTWVSPADFDAAFAKFLSQHDMEARLIVVEGAPDLFIIEEKSKPPLPNLPKPKMSNPKQQIENLKKGAK